MAKLKEVYHEKAVPALMKRFNYKNRMEVPKLEKIVINMGLGEAIQNIKILDSAVQEISCSKRSRSPILRMGTRRFAKRGVPTASGSRRTTGTPQRVRERTNSADGPFSAAC